MTINFNQAMAEFDSLHNKIHEINSFELQILSKKHPGRIKRMDAMKSCTLERLNHLNAQHRFVIVAHAIDGIFVYLHAAQAQHKPITVDGKAIAVHILSQEESQAFTSLLETELETYCTQIQESEEEKSAEKERHSSQKKDLLDKNQPAQMASKAFSPFQEALLKKVARFFHTLISDYRARMEEVRREERELVESDAKQQIIKSKNLKFELTKEEIRREHIRNEHVSHQ